MIRFRSLLYVSGILLIISQNAISDPFVEKHGRIELNWSTQRIKFYGIGDEGAFGDSDRAAWNEGLSYMLAYLPKIRSNYDNMAGGASIQAGHRVASATYRVKTHYYANGAVKVEMESQLSRALSPIGLIFDLDEPLSETSRSSRIVIEMDKPFSPVPLYQIKVDGEVVYSYRSVAKASFERALMGAFFLGKKASDLKRFAGKSPAILKGKQIKGGIAVSKGDWQRAIKGNAGLISRAGVTISFPNKG